MEKIKYIQIKDKIKVNTEEPKKVELCEGIYIDIKEQISAEDYILISKYIEQNALKENVENKSLVVRVLFLKGVLETCTNLEADDMDIDFLLSKKICNILEQNIGNFNVIYDCIKAEYNEFLINDVLKALLDAIPSAKQINNTLEKAKKTLKEMDSDKLETVMKGIALNNAPVYAVMQKMLDKDKNKDNDNK